MMKFQDAIWPEEEIRRSRIDAREIAKARKKRRRQDRLWPLAMFIGASAYCFLLLWFTS